MLLTCLTGSWAQGDVFLSDQRIATLKARVEAKEEPTWTAWQEVKKAADAALQHEPGAPAHWHVPAYYVDGPGHVAAKKALMDDGIAAYALALAYRVTGDEAYARSAARIIDAWTSTVQTLSREADSGLSFSYHYPALIFAADLIRESPSWPEEPQRAFEAFLRDKALPQNTMHRANNWGNWGLVLFMACAAYLEDEALFEQGVARWKELLETQVAEDGHLPHEVHREGHGRPGDFGMWYSNFCLMPQTLAAEIARVNGTDFYGYRSPSGRTLRQAFEWLAPYVREPAKFPYFQGGDIEQLRGVDYVSYFEILNARWPHPDATAVLERLRPLTAWHSAPFLTFTHGGVLEDK
jgi:hypothetical protein